MFLFSSFIRFLQCSGKKKKKKSKGVNIPEFQKRRPNLKIVKCCCVDEPELVLLAPDPCSFHYVRGKSPKDP